MVPASSTFSSLRGPLAGLVHATDGGSSSDEMPPPPISGTAAGTDGAAARPSFKRLASQTLEKAGTQKKALFRWGGDGEDNEDGDGPYESETTDSEAGPERMRMGGASYWLASILALLVT